MELKKLGKKGGSELNIPLKVFGVIFGIVILAFLTIVVAGNLRDSTGFTTGDADYNVTQNVMTNVTTGVATFFSNLDTIYTIAFVVMIIAMIMIVWTISKKATVGGGTA